MLTKPDSLLLLYTLFTLYTYSALFLSFGWLLFIYIQIFYVVGQLSIFLHYVQGKNLKQIYFPSTVLFTVLIYPFGIFWNTKIPWIKDKYPFFVYDTKMYDRSTLIFLKFVSNVFDAWDSYILIDLIRIFDIGHHLCDVLSPGDRTGSGVFTDAQKPRCPDAQKRK